MLKPFWMRKPPNYGDIMTPYILSKMGIPYRWTRALDADSLFIGSIASFARKGMHVFGSGFIRGSDEAEKEAVYHFVRGPLTREKVLDAGGACPETYGDLALVMPSLMPPSPKEHDIGYTPHGVEYDLFPDDSLKINLYSDDIEDVTRQITKCRSIVSSSLHGIIVAHAYGIPAAYVSMSDKLKGDGFKFRDYYASVGLVPEISTLENPVFQLPVRIPDMTEPMRILKDFK